MTWCSSEGDPVCMNMNKSICLDICHKFPLIQRYLILQALLLLVYFSMCFLVLVPSPPPAATGLFNWLYTPVFANCLAKVLPIVLYISETYFPCSCFLVDVSIFCDTSIFRPLAVLLFMIMDKLLMTLAACDRCCGLWLWLLDYLPQKNMLSSCTYVLPSPTTSYIVPNLECLMFTYCCGNAKPMILLLHFSGSYVGTWDMWYGLGVIFFFLSPCALKFV